MCIYSSAIYQCTYKSKFQRLSLHVYSSCSLLCYPYIFNMSTSSYFEIRLYITGLSNFEIRLWAINTFVFGKPTSSHENNLPISKGRFPRLPLSFDENLNKRAKKCVKSVCTRKWRHHIMQHNVNSKMFPSFRNTDFWALSISLLFVIHWRIRRVWSILGLFYKQL